MAVSLVPSALHWLECHCRLLGSVSGCCVLLSLSADLGAGRRMLFAMRWLLLGQTPIISILYPKMLTFSYECGVSLS